MIYLDPFCVPTVVGLDLLTGETKFSKKNTGEKLALIASVQVNDRWLVYTARAESVDYVVWDLESFTEKRIPRALEYLFPFNISNNYLLVPAFKDSVVVMDLESGISVRSWNINENVSSLWSSRFDHKTDSVTAITDSKFLRIKHGKVISESPCQKQNCALSSVLNLFVNPFDETLQVMECKKSGRKQTYSIFHQNLNQLLPKQCNNESVWIGFLGENADCLKIFVDNNIFILDFFNVQQYIKVTEDNDNL